MKIGSVETKNNVFLAPMAGITDLPFRLICREMGCGLAYTEMASSKAFEYSSEKTKRIFEIDNSEKPSAVQIFGSDPYAMAKIASHLSENNVDIIDINMGCPAPKIVKNGEGSALMLQPEKAKKIISEVVRNSSRPVTVKMRKAWDDTGKGIGAVELSKIAECLGVSAVTIHGRTREQYYSGFADWNIIKEVKDSVKIPVIGNGDIVDHISANKMLIQTKCDGLMIGRAAQGNPWIFSQIINFFNLGEIIPSVCFNERIYTALRHYKHMISYKGEYTAVREMRKHIAWYIKSIKNAASIREKINKIDNSNEVILFLEQMITEASYESCNSISNEGYR